MTGRPREIERHGRVYIHPRCALPGCPVGVETNLRAWAEAGRPFVARRAEGAAEGFVPLAWQSGRAKAAFVVAAESVLRHELPLTVSEALPAFPGDLADAVTRLDGDATRMGITLRLYGSWFWQAVSGETCTTPRSDIDLLFAPASVRQLDAALALLSDAAANLRLDGEAIFLGGWGVSWRELAQYPAVVLARSRASAALLPRAQLLSSLREAA